MTTNSSDSTKLTPVAKRAILGSWLGFYVDMFDIYLPVLILAPAMIYFLPADLDPATAAIVTGMIFAVTLIGRPLGAAIFGHLGDKIGRKRPTVIASVGFGVVTLAIGLLPGYETIGLTAIVLIIALRFVDGIFLGGQYTVSTPLALEYTPKAKRGLYGGIIKTGYPLAYTSMAGLTFLMLQIMPAGGLDSPYVQWGWRIPFLIGALMGFVFAIWYSRNVEESTEWKKAVKVKSPVIELFRKGNFKILAQIFILMTGMWLSQNMVGAALPLVLKNHVGLSSEAMSLILFFATGILVFAYVGAGALSQIIGRRPFIVATGIVTMFVAPVLFWLFVSGVVSGFGGIFMLVTLLSVSTGSIWGVVATYINERFAVGVRSSGFGVGYSLAVIIPAFYAFYQAGLANLMPFEYTPMVLIAVAGLLILVGGLLGPETRGVDMIATVHQPATTDEMQTAQVPA